MAARLLAGLLAIAMLGGCATYWITEPSRKVDRIFDRGDRLTLHMHDGRRIEATYKAVGKTELVTTTARYPFADIKEISYRAPDRNFEQFMHFLGGGGIR